MRRRDLGIAALVFVVLYVAFVALSWTRSDVDVPDRPYAVVVDARVLSDARATVTIAPNVTTREGVREVAAEMAESLLGGRATKVTVRTADGKPYAVVRLRDVFEPGPRPQLNVHAGRAYELADPRGWAVEVRLKIPQTYRVAPRWAVPPARTNGFTTFAWDHGFPPHGTVRFDPAVGRAWVVTTLGAVATVAAFLGISLWPHRRARGRFACGALAVGCGVAAIVLVTWPAENLGVAGVASGTALTALTLLMLAWLLAIPAGLWLLLTPRRRKARATMRA